MKKNNLILDKTYAFALQNIELYKHLRYEKKEYDLSRQILKSGTSMGANAKEGDSAQSKNDFISKFSIVLKESRETHYWLRLLRDSNYIDADNTKGLIDDCDEIIRITTSILKTSRV